jgi:hypothetical protein
LFWDRRGALVRGLVFLRDGQNITVQYPAIPRAVAVMTGGPSSSGPAMPPCAYAFEYQSPSQMAAIITDRKSFVPVNILESLGLIGEFFKG